MKLSKIKRKNFFISIFFKLSECLIGLPQLNDFDTNIYLKFKKRLETRHF